MGVHSKKFYRDEMAGLRRMHKSFETQIRHYQSPISRKVSFEKILPHVSTVRYVVLHHRLTSVLQAQ